MDPLYYLFLGCALLGSTVVVFQFVLSLVGLGEGHDVPDAGHVDFSHDVSHDMGHGHDGHHETPGHSSAWVFGAFSLRAIVAGVAFFGLSGLTGLSLHLSTYAVVPIALASGFAALGVAQVVLTMLFRIRSDGTLRIERAIGKSGTVNLSIPANNTGAGKVQVSVQGRLEEFRAITSGPLQLGSGAKVVVIGVCEPRTLEVAPLTDANQAA